MGGKNLHDMPENQVPVLIRHITPRVVEKLITKKEQKHFVWKILFFFS